jgi:predicted enzyme related to lactoylglutathione lyase
MTESMTAVKNKPIWVDLAAKDPAAARDFYAKVLGWDVQVNPEPEYGGYGRAVAGGKDAAGIGGAMSPDQPAAWSLYVGTDDAEALATKVTEAGGTVVMAPFDVGDQGRMAVFQDASGAFISAWQTTGMDGFHATGNGSYGWAELTARGIEAALPFYERVFAWTLKPSGSPDQPYTEFQVDGQSIGGATEMPAMVPAGTPNNWRV